MAPNKLQTIYEDFMLKNDGSSDIEYILNDLGGSYGKFQLINYILFSIPIGISAMVGMTYVFTTLNLEYRCNISECDSVEYPIYDEKWIKNAIPFKNLKPAKCERYEQISTNVDSIQGFCRKDSFNTSNIMRCEQDGLIYSTDEVSILNEFNLTCAENEWKLAAVGSYGNIARLLFLFFVGIFSDSFGRKTVLIAALFLSSTFGLIQSFSVNYMMFIVLEFLVASMACAVYPAAFILGIEWAAKDQRVLIASLITTTYTFGLALSGVLASYAHHFRFYLRLIYVPGFLVALLMFLGSESLRWLLVNGKKQRVEKMLKVAEKMNNRKLSENSLQIVIQRCENVKRNKETGVKNVETNDENSLTALFQNKTLAIRFVISAFCWIAAMFTSYGVSVISVSLHGDKYMSFIFVALGAAPNSLTTVLALKYMGRVQTISMCFLMTGMTVVCAKLLPVDYSMLALFLFIAAKLFSSMVAGIIYIHTTELWPTPLRHTILGLSSTIGRIGSIMAPLTPLLANIMDGLPYFSFGIVAVIAAVLVIFLPETRNQHLPDTLEEAVSIGKKGESS